jgi:hypothetical protein
MQQAPLSESGPQARRAASAASIGRVRGVERRGGVTPEALSEIEEMLLEPANRRESFPQADFPRGRKVARLERAHLFRASCFPLSRLEPRFAELVPRRERSGRLSRPAMHAALWLAQPFQWETARRARRFAEREATCMS